MSSKARKRRQKQKAVDSQKMLKLELKERQSSLEKERRLCSSLQRYFIARHQC